MNQAHDMESKEDTQGGALGTRPTLFSGMSLRTKGVWVMVMFFTYTLLAGLVMARERNILYSDVQQLEAVHTEEESQFSLNLLVTRATLVVNDNYYSVGAQSPGMKFGMLLVYSPRARYYSVGTPPPGLKAAVRNVAVQTDAVLTSLTKAAQTYPVLGADVAALRANLDNLVGRPAGLAAISDVRNNLHKLVLDLDQVANQMRSHKQTLLEEYRKRFDRLSFVWSFTAAIGVVFLGGLVMIFVTRLAWDIRRVQDRALAIVEGYRGKRLAVTRFDELGSLMEAINNMQLELRQHEMQMELIRQQRFHKEKMAAVGSLAAVVAHEINNPLSAIVGAAQSMAGLRDAQSENSEYAHQAEIILAQAMRVMNITRQISEFSMPQSTEPELLDLNSLIRSTAKFTSFDRRFSIIDMVLSLDPQLPAVRAVADHLTQVIMNLLINAADAAEGRVDPKPSIVISTTSQEGNIVVTVADNGAGMDKATLKRVFEEYFTTKPKGKGSGIGMAVSKSLIESGGGTISIESELDIGTTVTIKLPAAAA